MNAQIKVKYLKENSQNVHIIHYSCQNLGDNNENYSPRITSIAVLHRDSSTMHSFSIHLIAEIEKIKRENIHEHYDLLEEKMLCYFFKFVSSIPDAIWVHWNMSNINYGFETLYHRYKVLSGINPSKIPDSKKINLSSLISALYGDRCVEHPRMKKLMELNDGNHKDLLTGAEEVAAFESKEYIKLHNSTMQKVYWFNHALALSLANKLNTKNNRFIRRINFVLDSTAAKILGFAAIVFTIIQFAYFINDKYAIDHSIKTAGDRIEKEINIKRISQ
ncbi:MULTISPECIES: hypothetical protein [Aeromonas]|uniref:hypothetical protein n=1 Tax=Aeromonas TaxID=642 RepID=UPI000A5811ED|nr:hypothetical protein [Aeromonas veronii]